MKHFFNLKNNEGSEDPPKRAFYAFYLLIAGIDPAFLSGISDTGPVLPDILNCGVKNYYCTRHLYQGASPATVARRSGESSIGITPK
jgi:hypothetical protein